MSVDGPSSPSRSGGDRRVIRAWTALKRVDPEFEFEFTGPTPVARRKYRVDHERERPERLRSSLENVYAGVSHRCSVSDLLAFGDVGKACDVLSLPIGTFRGSVSRFSRVR